MMIHKALENLKITALNAMQLASLEAAKKKNDMVLLSPTGSGKTLGFLLPVLTRLDKNKIGVQALVLVPSRELGLQIEQVFKQMSTGFKVNCCYGGHPTKIEKNNLEHAPALLIGTPGRIAYHVRHRSFDPLAVHMLVLDEFDKSLEFGFKEDMSFIIHELKNVSRRMLTSATKMDEIPDFTGVSDPTELNFLGSEPATSKALTLKSIRATGTDKLETLFTLVCSLGSTSTLVFCNHREAVERISELLMDKGLAHGIFHGGMEQEDRERSLIKFRNGSYRILITTDLASRGLDIPEIETVIHYQLPQTEDVYIHRNGRTARMKAEGVAYLVLSEQEYMPEFIKEKPEEVAVPENTAIPEPAPWTTIYIAAGKKDKVNKVDIVGLLLQKGNLQKDELGLIEVLDYSSYAAVRRSKAQALVQALRSEKIKNKKVKIDLSK